MVKDLVDGSEAAVRREVRVRPPETSRPPDRVAVAAEVTREKKVRAPSRVEAQSWVESGEMARQRTSDVKERGSEVGVRVKMDQRRMVRSQEPEARVAPSGVKARLEMGPSWPASWSRSWATGIDRACRND